MRIVAFVFVTALCINAVISANDSTESFEQKNDKALRHILEIYNKGESQRLHLNQLEDDEKILNTGDSCITTNSKPGKWVVLNLQGQGICIAGSKQTNDDCITLDGVIGKWITTPGSNSEGNCQAIPRILSNKVYQKCNKIQDLGKYCKKSNNRDGHCKYKDGNNGFICK